MTTMRRLLVVYVWFLVISGVDMSGNSPVLLWGTNSTSMPALMSMDDTEFANDVILPLLKHYMVVLFLEDYLEPQDFLCKLPENEALCFGHLQKVRPMTYYAQVLNPLQSLGPFATMNMLQDTGQLKFPLGCAAQRLHVINFNDSYANSVGFERQDLLQQHDFLMAGLGRRLRHCPVVYAYMMSPQKTAPQFTSLSRQRRQIQGPYKDGFLFRNDIFAIYFNKLVLSEYNGTQELTVFQMNATGNEDEMRVLLHLNDSSPITFDVSFVKGYYNLRNLSYEDKIYVPTKHQVQMPKLFSYYCGELELASNTSVDGVFVHSQIIWYKLQFQHVIKKYMIQKKAPTRFRPGQKDRRNQSLIVERPFEFEDPWYCDSFVSPAIVMGLFVVSILLGILGCAISSLSNVQTMSQFEDPLSMPFVTNTL